ncbi:hypothetical protein BpHYR1_003743 [Brachionus plicatilis]|uniref:Secreted protein n=1 Tax=Brachionus plicatilis TaxID=10195 RepID=A0A3M7QTA4_BRAPC|nr:hypothetical protein BpHYR1_003743 [Brachionus plicatilis]
MFLIIQYFVFTLVYVSLEAGNKSCEPIGLSFFKAMAVNSTVSQTICHGCFCNFLSVHANCKTGNEKYINHFQKLILKK